MAAVLLALGTSASYGVANLLGPLLARRHPLAAVLLVGQGAALVLAVGGLLVSGEPAPGSHALLIGLVAGVGNAVGLITFLLAAERGPVSLVAPIGATGGALPVIYDVAGGASLSTVEVAGLACALTGVILASRRSAPEAGAVAESAAVIAGRARDLRACVLLSLSSALGFGTLLIALPRASRDGRWWALADARAVIVLGVLAFAVLARRSLRAPLQATPVLAVPGLLLLTGTLVYTLAAERGSLSLVAVLASLNPAVTVTLAFVVLHERLSRVQTAGILLTVAGVALIAS